LNRGRLLNAKAELDRE
jgi:hypothetical protein